MERTYFAAKIEILESSLPETNMDRVDLIHDKSKVIAVFIGGREIPSWQECQWMMALDREVELPVLVIPFGGDDFDPSRWNDADAYGLVFQITPEFCREGFFYRCTRILDKLLVKVLVKTDGSWW